MQPFPIEIENVATRQRAQMIDVTGIVATSVRRAGMICGMADAVNSL